MNRYTPTERIGINEVEKVIIKNIGWIFREQPIADVGIDAIIEQVENGEPTGKFIALQIKTGKGNFHTTEKGLTYYASHIHYNYWLNLNIPIILVAHLPENGETYWQEISSINIKKNKKSWKFEIPFKQKLCEKSINRLEKILSSKNDKKFDVYLGRVDSNDLEDILEDIKSLKDATTCMLNISEILKTQTAETNRITNQLNNYIKGDSYDNLNILYKSLAKSINLTARRSETEIELFSQLYSTGISAFHKVIISLKTLNIKFSDLDIDVSTFINLPDQINFTISTNENLRESVNSIPNKSTVLKESKKQYTDVLDLIINELQDAHKKTKTIFAEII
jgi:hypothetical protein